jgi:hypothetical protein
MLALHHMLAVRAMTEITSFPQEVHQGVNIKTFGGFMSQLIDSSSSPAVFIGGDGNDQVVFTYKYVGWIGFGV